MWLKEIIATAFGGLCCAVLISVQPLQASEPVNLVVIGDSLTAGYGLPEADAFPARLEQALLKKGQAVRVVNAGVSGDTTAGGRARLAWAIGDQVDAVIVELGANDALRGLAPEQAFENLSAILKVLQDRKMPTLLAGMKAPPNMGEDYAREFDALYQRLASAYDVIFYPFFLEGVAGQPGLNQDDGLHPTAAGVDVIVENIMPAVEELLARANRK
ncbi:MAG: arylesterase [Rhodospirillales bacterium]